LPHVTLPETRDGRSWVPIPPREEILKAGLLLNWPHPESSAMKRPR
jgi:hypothetical protein